MTKTLTLIIEVTKYDDGSFLCEMSNPSVIASGSTEKQALKNLIDDLVAIDDFSPAEPEGSGVISNGLAMEEHPGLKGENIKSL